MSWDQMLEPGVVVHASPVETDRFGYSIERVTIGPGPIDEGYLLELIKDRTADILIVRYDAARLELAGLFARSRRAVVAAGALTYWEKPVSVAEPPEPSHIKVLSAEAMNLETVSTLVRNMVRESFRDYGNHYTANPLLDRSAALAGYEDWAVRSLSGDPGNVLVMMDEDKPIGMATLAAGADGGHLEILLAGLVPAAQGKRLYDALLNGCERVAVARGAQRVVISTQVHNVRAQRAWARQGLRPFAAVETVHLIERDLLNALARPAVAQDAVSPPTGLTIGRRP